MKNIGKLDKMIRLVLGFVFLYLGLLPGSFGWILVILGLVMWYTAWKQECCVYNWIGYKGTYSAKEEPKAAPKQKKKKR